MRCPRTEDARCFLTGDGAPRPLTPDQVGYVYSTPILPDFLTGYEFIRFFMDLHEGNVPVGKTIDDYFDMDKIDVHDRAQADQGYSHG